MGEGQSAQFSAGAETVTRVGWEDAGTAHLVDDFGGGSSTGIYHNLQVRSIGKRDCGNLFKLGDDMIQFGGLHALLAASVADMLPVNVGLLLSDDAKRQSRAATARRQASGVLPHEDGHGAAVKSFEGLMNSPWKVRACVLNASPTISCKSHP